MQLKGHLDYSFAAAWHPDGHVVATGNQVRRGLQPPRGALPAGRTCSQTAGKLQSFLATGLDGNLCRCRCHSKCASCLLLFPWQDMTTRLWDLRYPAASFALLKAHIGAIRALRFRCAAAA